MAFLDPKKLLNASDPKKISEPKLFLVPVKNVEYKKIAELSSADSNGQGDDKKSSLEEDIKIIKEKTIKIEDILKKTIQINLKKIELNRKQEQQGKREDKENKLESKGKSKDVKDLTKFIPGLSLIDRIKQFLGSIFAGFLVLRLVKLLPKLLDFLKFIKPVTSFISDFVSGMLDKLVTGIEIGYNIVDGIESKVKDVFGEEGQKQFNEFTKTFTKFMNLAIIAGMLSSGGKNPLRNRRFDGPQRRGFDRSGRRTSTSLQRRYRQRYGDRKFVERFGRKNLDRLNRSTPSPRSSSAPRGLQKPLQEGVTRIAGRRVGSLAGRIPIVGPIIDFGIRTLVFKEPLGKAAAGAVGAGVGQAIGTWLGGSIGGIAGSVVPIVGNLIGASAGATIGAIVGGFIGDQIGVSLYNVITSNSSEPVQSKSGGGSTSKKDKSKSIRKIKPQKYQPDNTDVGKSLGKKKITGFYGGNDVRNPPPALIALKTLSDNLKGSNKSLLSRIASIGVDLTLGQKPSSRSISNLSLAFSELIGGIMSPYGNIQMMSSGGEVDNVISEYSTKIINYIQSRFTRELNEVITKFKNLTESNSITNFLNDPLRLNPDGGGSLTPSQQEAFEKIRKIAEKLKSPNPSVTAAIAMYESGWLANPNSVYFASGKTNPFGQSGVGTKGSVAGRGGQKFAVYNNIEEGVKAHLDRWKSSYIGKTPQEIIENIRRGSGKDAPGMYNSESGVNWSQNVLNILQSGSAPKPSKLTNASFSAVLPEGNPQLTSGFGKRNIDWGSKDHKGIDIGVDRGSKVLALADGTVSIIPSFMHGSAVVITHSDGTKTLYGHVDPTVKNGVKVKKGQVIAKVKFWPKGVAGAKYPDNTHLHLERHIGGRPVDPSGFLNSLKPKPKSKSTPKPDTRPPSPPPPNVRNKLTRQQQWKPEDSGLKLKNGVWVKASIAPSKVDIASLETLKTRASYEETGTTTVALIDNTVYVPVPV